MTVSPNKKSKDKRYRFDSELIVSDRGTPLSDVLDDEDAIDRLLISTGFDEDQDNESKGTRNVIIDELDLSGESEELTKQALNQKVESESKRSDLDSETSVSNLMASVESYAFVTNPPSSNETCEAGESDIEIKPKPLLDDDEPIMIPIGLAGEKFTQVEELIALSAIQQESEQSVANIELNPERRSWGERMNTAYQGLPDIFDQFISEQEAFNQNQEQLIEHLVAKTKKAMHLGYAAFGFSATAIVVALLLLAMSTNQPQLKMTGLSKRISDVTEERPAINKEDSQNDLSTYTAIDSDSPTTETGSFNSKIEAQITPVERNSPKVVDSDRQSTAQAQNRSPSVWFVNLISLKERSDAVIQASEFIRKGIRAEMIEVKVNDVTWYRLRVGGFASKEQAAAYAEKIKKPMQLNSIWIASR